MRKSRLISIADQAYKNMMGLPALEGEKMALEQFGNPMGRVTNFQGVVPEFGAQIDISVSKYLSGTVATKKSGIVLPVSLFGFNDYKANYAKNIGNYDLPANVRFVGIEVYPKITGVTVLAGAKIGDLVFHYEFDDSVDQADIYLVVSCKNVAMASLVEATGSDRFKMNLLRYSVPSATDLTQFSRQITPRKQSLFGRTTDDSLNPKSFKSKDQNQPDIIDIPYEYDITKQTSLNTEVTLDIPTMGADVPLTELFTWSIFVTVAETTTSI